MGTTHDWVPDDKRLSPRLLLNGLFGPFLEFFKSELHALWTDPTSRKALLSGLADKGFGREPLREMQSIIEAEKLTSLLKLRYNKALNDAMAHLGDAVQVIQAFVGMQRYLYQ